MRPQCLKLSSWHIAVVREGDSEEIAENIEGNLEEDATNNVSEEGKFLQKRKKI